MAYYDTNTPEIYHKLPTSKPNIKLFVVHLVIFFSRDYCPRCITNNIQFFILLLKKSLLPTLFRCHQSELQMGDQNLGGAWWLVISVFYLVVLKLPDGRVSIGFSKKKAFVLLISFGVYFLCRIFIKKVIKLFGFFSESFMEDSIISQKPRSFQILLVVFNGVPIFFSKPQC